ncbi:MAG: heavy metal transporter [Epsilonproteobacteria bacterium]|nr:heavy metal transporter [Campylobacterota bacterium]
MNQKQTFAVLNVKCSGCANTLKKSLLEEFGEVEINLDIMPREITLNIDATQIESLKSKLKTLGYPFVTDELNTIEKITTTAKSFISCAIGKIDN